LKLNPTFEERHVDGRGLTYKIGRDLDGNAIKEKVEFDSWNKRD